MDMFFGLILFSFFAFIYAFAPIKVSKEYRSKIIDVGTGGNVIEANPKLEAR